MKTTVLDHHFFGRTHNKHQIFCLRSFLYEISSFFVFVCLLIAFSFVAFVFASVCVILSLLFWSEPKKPRDRASKWLTAQRANETQNIRIFSYGNLIRFEWLGSSALLFCRCSPFRFVSFVLSFFTSFQSKCGELLISRSSGLHIFVSLSLSTCLACLPPLLLPQLECKSKHSRSFVRAAVLTVSVGCHFILIL